MKPPTKKELLRWRALAMKDAVGNINPAEMVELDALQRRRDQPSPEDAVFYKEQQRVTDDLLLALSEYVKFHKKSNHEKENRRTKSNKRSYD